MGQYSELIGSFKRMGNFPLEADYIFNSEEELKDFYSQEENAVLLHRGLFKIVGQRRGLLKYLEETDIERYRSLIERLGIRK